MSHYPWIWQQVVLSMKLNWISCLDYVTQTVTEAKPNRWPIDCRIWCLNLLIVVNRNFTISFVFRWSKRRPKRRVLTWDRADEAVGCTSEHCIPGWLLHFAGAQVPGDRVRSVWWFVAMVTTQEAIGKAFPKGIVEEFDVALVFRSNDFTVILF